MSLPVGKAFDHLVALTELSNNINFALQSHTEARTAIRDYVISANEEHYTLTNELNEESIGFLEATEPMIEKGGPLDSIHLFIDDIREWRKLARQVHQTFIDYKASVQDQVLFSFSDLSQQAAGLLQENVIMMGTIVLEVQVANVTVVNYLIKGEPEQADEAQAAIKAVKAKLNEIIEKEEKKRPSLEAFATSLASYEKGFQKAVESRTKAYQLFNDKLAPLGDKICDDLKDYQNQLLDIQEGINDLKQLNDYKRKNNSSPLQ